MRTDGLEGKRGTGREIHAHKRTPQYAGEKFSFVPSGAVK